MPPPASPERPLSFDDNSVRSCRCTRFVAALERGGAEDHLHIQAAVEGKFTNASVFTKALKVRLHSAPIPRKPRSLRSAHPHTDQIGLVSLLGRAHNELFLRSTALQAFLGWNKGNQPADTHILTRRLTGRGLHTFIGLVGYCLKDSGLPHFRVTTKGVTDRVRHRTALTYIYIF